METIRRRRPVAPTPSEDAEVELYLGASRTCALGGGEERIVRGPRDVSSARASARARQRREPTTRRRRSAHRASDWRRAFGPETSRRARRARPGRSRVRGVRGDSGDGLGEGRTRRAPGRREAARRRTCRRRRRRWTRGRAARRWRSRPTRARGRGSGGSRRRDGAANRAVADAVRRRGEEKPRSYAEVIGSTHAWTNRTIIARATPSATRTSRADAELRQRIRRRRTPTGSPPRGRCEPTSTRPSPRDAPLSMPRRRTWGALNG